jgi:uracil-DNA glycosylase
MVVVTKPKISRDLEWVIDQIHPSWIDIFLPFFYSDKWKAVQEKLKTSVLEGNQILPSHKEYFTCFSDCKRSDVRVLMLGQDPYFTPGVANGRAFCCAKTGKAQPSLIKIQEELEKQISGYKRKEDLKYWGEQGILLLNSSLTVVPFRPNSHRGIWTEFIKYIVSYLNWYSSGSIFVFMGKPAQSFSKYVGSQHYKVDVEHPAAACYGGSRDWESEGLFLRINEILVSNNGYGIDW